MLGATMADTDSNSPWSLPLQMGRNSTPSADELIQLIITADCHYDALQITDRASCTPDLIRSQYVKVGAIPFPLCSRRRGYLLSHFYVLNV